MYCGTCYIPNFTSCLISINIKNKTNKNKKIKTVGPTPVLELKNL